MGIGALSLRLIRLATVADEPVEDLVPQEGFEGSALARCSMGEQMFWELFVRRQLGCLDRSSKQPASRIERAVGTLLPATTTTCSSSALPSWPAAQTPSGGRDDDQFSSRVRHTSPDQYGRQLHDPCIRNPS